ncbi:hypothetical protein BH09PAT1_BH09PAT1_0070 [soil metagenome]
MEPTSEQRPSLKEKSPGEEHSGFELKPVIDFYTLNAERILALLPLPNDSNLEYPIEQRQNIHLTPSDISSLLNLFPSSFKQRTELRNGGTFIGIPTTYFARDSTPGDIRVTDKVEEALSPTAFATAYADSNTDENGIVSCHIGLAKLPDIIPTDVKKIIQSHAIIHEGTHSITSHLLENETLKIKLPSGEVISGKKCIERIALVAEKYRPMSHYTSGYRKADQLFNDLPESERTLAMEEELCEMVAAHLLGFVFAEDDLQRQFEPFKGREDLVPLIEDFLKAEEIVE